MASCMECIHFNPCNSQGKIIVEKPTESNDWGLHNKIENECKYFTPTADFLEVVRCEDCKCLMKEIVVEQTPYGFENEKIEFGCQRILDLTGEWVDVMLDDFCSYGERRDT